MVSVIPSEFRRLRAQRDKTQTEFGREIGISPQMVGLVEQGRRYLARDIRRTLSMTQRDYRFALAVADEATGGLGPPPLDLEGWDHTPTGSGLQVDEDLAEAVAARAVIRRNMKNVRRGSDLTPEKRAEIVEALKVLARESTSRANHMHAVCMTTGIDPAGEVWWPVRAEYAAQGLIPSGKRKEPPPLAPVTALAKPLR